MSDEVQVEPDVGTVEGNQQTETETEASIEDAILDLETEANSEDEETEEKPQPRKFRVKGQEVDESELINGYLRQSDYSRAMNQAQERIRAEEASLREAYQQRIDQFIPEQEAKLVRMQQELQVLAQEDPASWVVRQQEFQTELMRYQQAQGERQRLNDEQAHQDAQMRDQARAYATSAVLEAIPEWKNEAVAASEKKEVTKIIVEEVTRHFGNNANKVLQDIHDGLYGPMPVIWAREAMQYRKLMQKVAQRKASKSEQSEAPAPVKSVKSSGGAAKDPRKMSMDEYAAWRMEQKRKRA